jgi:hypothetical protein
MTDQADLLAPFSDALVTRAESREKRCRRHSPGLRAAGRGAYQEGNRACESR